MAKFSRNVRRSLLVGVCLIIMSTGCQAYKDPNSRTVGEFTDDAGIQAGVKTALIRDPKINGLGINTEVKKGVVALYGRIPSEALRSKAVAIAGSVKGVVEVVDRLTIVP